MDTEDRTEFFQEGFEGFPRSLPDNCVEYMLFIIDSQLDARTLLAELEKIRKSATQLCNRVASEYIWQRDSFQLGMKRDTNLVYLHGRTDYGDSVEDEWLIVYLLRELTRSFPNLWVRVFDTDGEFLLVEAANVVPKWLSPEIDSNRVWLHQGALRILPLDASHNEKRPLSLLEAVTYLKEKPESPLHSTFIEAEAFYRLEKYPGQITDSLHHSLVTLPRKVAYILHELPTSIAPAVEAFYLRDPIALKPLLSSSSQLHFPPTNLVTVSVKFTKVLFAQLKSQRFAPPPIWVGIMEELEKEGIDAQDSSKKRERLEIGMKITSGFEMLAAGASKKDNRLAREFAIVLEDLEEDGDEALPSDQDMAAWPNAKREDDDSWLDINFEDFEGELQGKRSSQKGPRSGFGDATTQADLRKIVSRFEAFLNDESAGPEGAEMEDMDEDDDLSDEDDEDDEDSEDSEDEDKEVSFDEEQFSRMMREMMGMPSENSARAVLATEAQGAASTAEEEEDEAIRQLSAQMEAELNGLGALNLDTHAERPKAIKDKAVVDIKGKAKSNEVIEAEEDEDSEGGEVDIDYNLAKNLLESFKSQAGMAGPTGNLLGMMGMQLPRDEDEDEDGNEAGGSK
ncbi:SGT1-domain-containing protein [Xylariomycetidae sp. FL0641]|nr:SGT1-domain-containing protein [Xylariomycetidae sp. FL0641]